MKLLFIYNAKGGVVADITGAVKKVIGTGECSLCNATYGIVAPKKAWKTYLATFAEKPAFFHKDDMPKKVQTYISTENIALPVVLRKKNKGFEVVLRAQEMDSCSGSVECLISVLKDRLRHK